MRSATRLAVLVSFFVFLGLSTQARADKPTNTGKNKPKVIFDEDGTPLQKAIGKSVSDGIEKERHVNAACQHALDDPTPDPKKIAKFCKVPGNSSKKLGKDKCPDCGDMVNKNGKVIGKK